MGSRHESSYVIQLHWHESCPAEAGSLAGVALLRRALEADVRHTHIGFYGGEGVVRNFNVSQGGCLEKTALANVGFAYQPEDCHVFPDARFL
jgi:hypothetical protein